MILVDTSVWIDLLGNTPKHRVSREGLLELATCSPVIQEVLQGVKDDLAHQKLKEAMLALPRFGDPLSLDLFLEAHEIYRSARRRGITVRSSFDCLIAAIAIQHSLEVWHQDRDFEAIAKFTNLKTLTQNSFPQSKSKN